MCLNAWQATSVWEITESSSFHGYAWHDAEIQRNHENKGSVTDKQQRWKVMRKEPKTHCADCYDIKTWQKTEKPEFTTASKTESNATLEREKSE